MGLAGLPNPVARPSCSLPQERAGGKGTHHQALSPWLQQLAQGGGSPPSAVLYPTALALEAEGCR